jgi:uncharacterized protein with HEPN domain
MNERDELRLRHMRDAAANALHFVERKTLKNIEDDLLLAYGVVHAIQIIGEAASQITPELQEQHPEIEWQGIIGMRHRVVHGYDNVNYEIVWQVLQEKLPSLIRQLDVILPPFVPDEE